MGSGLNLSLGIGGVCCSECTISLGLISTIEVNYIIRPFQEGGTEDIYLLCVK